MENRFGFRDLITSALLVVLIVSVWLAMKQYGRQWEKLREINASLVDQKQELRRIRDLLGRGLQVSAPGPDSGGTYDGRDAFDRIRKAQALPDYARGDWLVRAFGVAVGKLTPLVSSDVYQRIVENRILEPLAQRDPKTLEWKPLIARTWQVSEDGLTITFDLRRDVRFSDGEPVRADDVVFTYNLIMNPKIAAPRDRAYYERVLSVKSDGDFRVVFTLREPYFKSFEICAGLNVMPEHFYGQFTEEQYNEMPGLLMGSGPYVLTVDPREWRPGSGAVEVVRNEGYWGVQPAFDRLVFQEITDDTARLTTFTNDEIDQYGPTPEQYLSLKDDEALRSRAELYEYEPITSGYRYIAWNQRRADKPTRFADRRVRQALTMLTNRGEMCERLMVGLATISTGPFHRKGTQADPTVVPWPYDPDLAISLLTEVGFKDRDGDGVIEDPNGDPFQFKLIYPASSANYHQMALYLKDAYARAGIVLEPDPLEWTIMLQRIDSRDFDAMTLGWSGTIEGDPNQIFHSSQVGEGGDNYIHLVNPELDACIDEARFTLDQDKRMKLWHKVHRILHEEQPYTFLFTQRSVMFIDRRVRNVRLTNLGLTSELEWFVPIEMQKWTQ